MVVDKVKFFLLCAKKCETVSNILKKAGLSTAVLASIKKGKNVKAETAGKLALALGCEPEELFKID